MLYGYLKLAATTLLISQMILGQAKDTAPIYTQQDTMRLATVIEHINQFYLDPVTYPDLVDSAIKGMLRDLDPHSDYLNAKSFKLLQSNTSNEFSGIGIEVTYEDGILKVVSPLDNSPALKSGIKPNDLISHINGQRIDKLSYMQAIQLIRGKTGSTVELVVIRDKSKKPLIIKVKRDKIQYSSVKHQLMNDVGYIRISSFGENTTIEVKKAIQSLLKKEISGLIIDLRNNPGGLLDTAISTTDIFLDANTLGKNKTIVYTKGRNPYSQLEAKATPGDDTNNLPLVVLINSGSASASEILAQALMDHERAIVIGTRSFGKGSVQTVLPIDKESAIKITTALYYSPKDISIQSNGVVPDIEIPELDISIKEKTGFSLDKYLREQNLSHHISAQQDSPAKDTTPNTNLAKQDFTLYQGLLILKGINAIDDHK
ncbi:S41 family peptidase [Gammaproteobacteria bacterium]|nr:S41 family peptidase [Gammaproteobacteria bacterium]